MVGYTVNSRGRYKCEFCDHLTYKTHGGVMAHINTHHFDLYQFRKTNAQLEETIAENTRTIERLKHQAPKVVEKERIVYRDPPKPKEVEYWYGVAGIYCSSCRRVQSNPGIPVGQTIENTPCSNCRNRTLMLVKEIN